MNRNRYLWFWFVGTVFYVVGFYKSIVFTFLLCRLVVCASIPDYAQILDLHTDMKYYSIAYPSSKYADDAMYLYLCYGTLTRNRENVYEEWVDFCNQYSGNQLQWWTKTFLKYGHVEYGYENYSYEDVRDSLEPGGTIRDR